jgi:hypothetical protein
VGTLEIRNTTTELMPLRFSLRAGLAAAAVLAIASPAYAELKVRVSKNVTGRYESVGITVTDPIGGLDAKPGPLTVTMADSTDHRQAIYLEPTGKPGERRLVGWRPR